MIKGHSLENQIWYRCCWFVACFSRGNDLILKQHEKNVCLRKKKEYFASLEVPQNNLPVFGMVKKIPLCGFYGAVFQISAVANGCRNFRAKQPKNEACFSWAVSPIHSQSAIMYSCWWDVPAIVVISIEKRFYSFLKDIPDQSGHTSISNHRNLHNNLDAFYSPFLSLCHLCQKSDTRTKKITCSLLFFMREREMGPAGMLHHKKHQSVCIKATSRNLLWQGSDKA